MEEEMLVNVKFQTRHNRLLDQLRTDDIRY